MPTDDRRHFPLSIGNVTHLTPPTSDQLGGHIQHAFGAEHTDEASRLLDAFAAELARHGKPVRSLDRCIDYMIGLADHIPSSHGAFEGLWRTEWSVEGRPIYRVQFSGELNGWLVEPFPGRNVLLRIGCNSDHNLTAQEIAEAIVGTSWSAGSALDRGAIEFIAARLPAMAERRHYHLHDDFRAEFETPHRPYGTPLTPEEAIADRAWSACLQRGCFAVDNTWHGKRWRYAWSESVGDPGTPPRISLRGGLQAMCRRGRHTADTAGAATESAAAAMERAIDALPPDPLEGMLLSFLGGLLGPQGFAGHLYAATQGEPVDPGVLDPNDQARLAEAKDALHTDNWRAFPWCAQAERLPHPRSIDHLYEWFFRETPDDGRLAAIAAFARDGAMQVMRTLSGMAYEDPRWHVHLHTAVWRFALCRVSAAGPVGDPAAFSDQQQAERQRILRLLADALRTPLQR